jgi:hypothetical protein
MVIYELFVRNFSEDGTFQGVEAGLDDIVLVGPAAHFRTGELGRGAAVVGLA